MAKERLKWGKGDWSSKSKDVTVLGTGSGVAGMAGRLVIQVVVG